MKEKYYVVAKTITKWKLDNPFENWLGYKADRSEFWKRLYVLYYKIFDKHYYPKGKKYIQQEIDKQLANLCSGELDFHQLNNGPVFGDETAKILNEVFDK